MSEFSTRLTGYAYGVHLRGLLAEIGGSTRSYPAHYEGGHILVGLGLADYADPPQEGRSYWVWLTAAGRAAIAAAGKAEDGDGDERSRA